MKSYRPKLNKMDINTNESEFEKKLHREMQEHVFSFFNQKDLKNAASVNKNFNKLSNKEIDQLKDKYADNIFYTVGNPIHISNPKRGMLEFDLAIKHRDKIPNKEIYESFLGKNIEELRLFKNEEEALEYSRFLRKGDQLLEGTEVYQPAVFKVILLHPIDDVEWQKEKLFINKGSWSTCYDMTERASTVGCFEANRVNVIPLEGVLKIHCGDKGTFITHGPIGYDNFNIDVAEEKTTSARCLVC